MVEAENLANALRIAATKLACPPERLRHKIIQEPRAGVLGLFSRKARVMAWFDDGAERHIDQAIHAVGNLDGNFVVEVRDTELLLTVFPPSGSGRAIDENSIFIELMEYEPEGLDEILLAQVAREADGAPHVIGKMDSSVSRDGKVEFQVADDAMTATMMLAPPRKGGRDISGQEIAVALVQAGIVHGIDANAVEKALQEKNYFHPMPIAAGSEPATGEAGVIAFMFRTDSHIVNFKEDKSGRVDYHDVDLIQEVRSGDVLARRVPAGPGKPGRDVLGGEIPARRGKEAKLPSGKNVFVDGNELKSGIDGHVSFEYGDVIVSPIYHVRGDVNLETGNIDYNGTVRVDGLIEDGFSVTTKGSLFVKKSIGKCRIDVAANLVVIGGILGRDEAVIKTGGDIVALFIEHSSVRAGRDVVVGEVILHSDVIAGRNLMMNGTRGAFIGGHVSTGSNITVRTLGGEGATRTHVRAGVKPDLLESTRSMDAELHDLEEKLAKIREALKLMETKGSQIADIERKRVLLMQSEAQIRTRIRVLSDALKNLGNKIETDSAHARIHVLDTALSGTRVEIGSTHLLLPTDVHYATFKKMAGEIKIFTYSERPAAGAQA